METKELHNRKLKLIVVDDSEMYRKVMKEFLHNELDCEVIAEANNGETFLQLPNIAQADIILMDLQMPRVNGFQSAQRMSIQYPQVKMIAVTMYTDSIYLSQLVELGFKGCVYKTKFFDDIIPAMHKVLTGGLYFNEEIPIAL